MANSPITIVNVGYRSTNYWVVGSGGNRLLVDIGWPGSLGAMKANLKRMGVPIGELRYALATHYHIDHAGLAEELKAEGIRLLVIDTQVDAIRQMTQWTKPEDNFVEITSNGNVVISNDESRRLLGELNIPGQIVHTPGHTDHCVSLLLDSGEVFTGDLPLEAMAFDNPTGLTTWQRLRELGAKTVYPAHGPIRPLAETN